jgi:hypothetical protein
MVRRRIGHIVDGAHSLNDLAGFVSGQHLLVTGGAPA